VGVDGGKLLRGSVAETFETQRRRHESRHSRENGNPAWPPPPTVTERGFGKCGGAGPTLRRIPPTGESHLAYSMPPRMLRTERSRRVLRNQVRGCRDWSPNSRNTRRGEGRDESPASAQCCA
jgi:hypothetical protein